MTAKTRATTAIGLMVFAAATAACSGGPQYASTPSELDSGISVADAPAPDSVTPVLTIVDAGPMATAQEQAVPVTVPVVNQTRVPE